MKTMTKTITKIKKVVKEVDGELVDNYSGRCMFGKTCYGVIGNSIQDLFYASCQAKLPKPCIDNMGLSYIAYWPNISKNEIE